jgi:ABC-2 type transport system permease protein
MGWRRTGSIARKEFLHILRDPTTLFFTLFIPVIEMFLLGYAIDTNVRNVRTVIWDEARTQESYRLIERFQQAQTLRIVRVVGTEAEMNKAIVSGEARVAIKIPEDFSRRIQSGTPAQFLVQVDGSESSVTGEVVNVASNIALQESIAIMNGQQGGSSYREVRAPVEVVPRVLFNPSTRSANFFLPGMLVVLCQMAAVLLTSVAIVREKENGTIEQLFMTPASARQLLVGKLAPYLIFSGIQFCLLGLVMNWVFQVPISGPFWVLFGIFQLFVLAMMGLGLAISTKAPTRDAAEQAAIGTVIPSIFLSGYIFPLDSMPTIFYYIAFLLPTTWMIDTARAVILRGAGWSELWLHAVVLTAIGVSAILASAARFRKHL